MYEYSRAAGVHLNGKLLNARHWKDYAVHIFHALVSPMN